MNTLKIAVFPGSFDPITRAHVEIIKRALPLFDQLYVAIGINSSKKGLISVENRLAIITETFKEESKIIASTFGGLTVDYCKKINAQFILRGMRNEADFGYEKAIAQNNTQLNKTIETVFFVSSPGFEHISSTIVRDIAANKGSFEHLVPPAVLSYL